MKFTIEITENELKECLLEVIKKKLSSEYYFDSRVFKKTYGDVIKEVIYEPKTKEEIIKKTIDQAAKEIKKKAMHLLTNRIFGEDSEG